MRAGKLGKGEGNNWEEGSDWDVVCEVVDLHGAAFAAVGSDHEDSLQGNAGCDVRANVRGCVPAHAVLIIRRILGNVSTS